MSRTLKGTYVSLVPLHLFRHVDNHEHGECWAIQNGCAELCWRAADAQEIGREVYPMMTSRVRRPALLLVVLLLSSGCQNPPPPKSVADQQSFRKPTAAEVFDLRTKCAELGEKLNGEYDFAKVAAPFLTQEHASHYNPKTNRCYVELHVGVNFNVFLVLSKGNAKARKMNAGFLEHYDLDFSERHLYDGQTGEELAFVQNGLKGVKATGIIKGRWTEPGDWAAAANEIDDLMADERK